MDEELHQTLLKIAAMLADVFPFIVLKWDPEEEGCFDGDIGKFHSVEVVPLHDFEVNGHVVDIFFTSKGEESPLSTFQIPGFPDWEKFESWLMEHMYREIIVEAAKALDACGIDCALPPLSVKHGESGKHRYVRPGGRPRHLVSMEELIWRGAALIGGPPGAGKTTVALHIAYAALDDGAVHVVTNEMSPPDFLNRFSSRFPQWMDDGKVLSVHGFDTEAKADTLFDNLEVWINGLDHPKLVILDDTVIVKKLRKRLSELARATDTRILGVTQSQHRATPDKWLKKLGDEAENLGAIFWVEWGERKDLGQLFVLKHSVMEGARLLPVTIQR